MICGKGKLMSLKGGKQGLMVLGQLGIFMADLETHGEETNIFKAILSRMKYSAKEESEKKLIELVDTISCVFIKRFEWFHFFALFESGV